MMAANISDGKLLCVSKLILIDENVILTDCLQLFLSSPITLCREHHETVLSHSYLSQVINSDEQGN